MKLQIVHESTFPLLQDLSYTGFAMVETFMKELTRSMKKPGAAPDPIRYMARLDFLWSTFYALAKVLIV